MLKNFLVKNIHQSYFLVVWAIGVLAGAILALVFRINYFNSPIWILFATSLLIIAYLKPRLIFIVFALIAGMVMVFFRVSDGLADEKYIQQFYGKTVTISGQIDGDPETDEKETKLKIINLKFGDIEEVFSGAVYMSVNKNEDLAWGDEVIVRGKLSEGFGTYVGYMYKPKITGWARATPGNLAIKIRNWFARRIAKLIPAPQLNLGLSYLLGMKTGLSDEFSDNLKTIGLTHIVVASGAHLSILVEIVKKCFGRVSRMACVIFSILFTLIFMAMVGWTPSIVRAGTMSILATLMWYSGRKLMPWRMIILVAAFTLILNPMNLINLGWLLSFASYGGIMILGPLIREFFYGKKKVGFLGSTVITTIAATLMTLPITLYYYGAMSTISVLANLLILPTLPYAMGLVFLSGAVYGVFGIEAIVSFLATKLLDFHILVVSWLGEMIQFLVKIPQYRVEVFWFYVIIAIFLVFIEWKKYFYTKKSNML